MITRDGMDHDCDWDTYLSFVEQINGRKITDGPTIDAIYRYYLMDKAPREVGLEHIGAPVRSVMTRLESQQRISRDYPYVEYQPQGVLEACLGAGGHPASLMPKRRPRAVLWLLWAVLLGALMAGAVLAGVPDRTATDVVEAIVWSEFCTCSLAGLVGLIWWLGRPGR